MGCIDDGGGLCHLQEHMEVCLSCYRHDITEIGEFSPRYGR